MWLMDQLAEERIREAQRQGAFDNLTGCGRPLRLDDDRAVPEALRAAYRLLKNAGYLPPELQLRREIADVGQLLAMAEHAEERATHSRRLSHLMLRLAVGRGSGANLQAEQAYFERLCEKLNGANPDAEPALGCGDA